MNTASQLKLPFLHSLTARVILGIIILDIILVAGIVILMNTIASKMVEDETSALIEESGNHAVSRLLALLNRAEYIARGMANTAEYLPHDNQVFKTVLENILDADHNPEIAGGGVWFEPGCFEPGLVRKSFFWGKDAQNHLRFFDDYNQPGLPYDEERFLSDPGYRKDFLAAPGYHNEEWYVVTSFLDDKRDAFWSQSYTDPYSYEPMVTVTVPIRNNDKQLLGVATVDLKLAGLHDLAVTWSKQTDGYLFIMDRNNKFITFPQAEKVRIPHQDEKGNQAERLMYAKSFAELEPAFHQIAESLGKLNQDLIQLAGSHSENAGLHVDAIDESSYQINRQDAELINAVMVDPMAALTGKSNLIDRIELPSDPILKREAVVTIFHVPKSYWKVVIVKSRAAYGSVAAHIKRVLLKYIGALILTVFCVACLYHLTMIVKPLKTITRKAARIGMELQAGKSINEIEDRRVDIDNIGEIGRLARVFNTMTEALVAAHLELKDYSINLEKMVEARTRELTEMQEIALHNAHAAGMAEMTTSILHNIGNVLNSLNILSEDNLRILKKNDYKGYQKAVNLLKANLHQAGIFFQFDQKGKLLPKYLEQIGINLTLDKDNLLSNSQEMGKHLRVVNDIIITQHNYAKGADLYEEVVLSGIVEDALNITAPALQNHGIAVKRDFRTNAVIRAPKIKLMHILINLIKNAKDAVKHLPPDQAEIQVAIKNDNSGKTNIVIRDNGVGIPTDQLQTIFAHGFTTKTHGFGFGLHYCANAATEMGARLSVESKGEGNGACFTLSFECAGSKDHVVNKEP